MNTMAKTTTKVRMHNMQKKHLKKGNVKSVGLVESCEVRRHGKNDGKQGLPKRNDTQEWYSPWMKKEEAAYEEFCSKAWGEVQLTLTDEYALIGMLLDKAEHLEAEVEELLVHRPEEQKEEDKTRRMKGEEDLSDDQIRRRRSREYSKKNEKYNSRMAELKAMIAETHRQLEEVMNYVLEVNKSTRMCCERVRNHVTQRRHIYWENAYVNHAQKDDMPSYPDPVSQTSVSEIKYMAQHQVMEKEAVAAIKRMQELLKNIIEIHVEVIETADERG